MGAVLNSEIGGGTRLVMGTMGCCCTYSMEAIRDVAALPGRIPDPARGRQEQQRGPAALVARTPEVQPNCRKEGRPHPALPKGKREYHYADHLVPRVVDHVGQKMILSSLVGAMAGGK